MVATELTLVGAEDADPLGFITDIVVLSTLSLFGLPKMMKVNDNGDPVNLNWEGRAEGGWMAFQVLGGFLSKRKKRKSKQTRFVS